MLYFIKVDPRILIVDDDSEIYESLAELLASEGFEPVWAKNAEEFKAQAFSHKPALIILDILLGRDNGTQTYNKLLLEGFDRKVPVVFLSGLVENYGTAPVLPGRTYALHSKPFKYEELLRDIRCLIQTA